MYRIYAEFDSRSAANRAADRLRSAAPGLGHITVSAKNKGRTDIGADTAAFSAESAFFAANNFFGSSAFPLASVLGGEQTPTHERFYDSLEHAEHMLSAEGPRSAAESAARLLRSCGGRNIAMTGERQL